MNQTPQTARGAIKHECDECGAGYATRDELFNHEIHCGWDDDDKPETARPAWASATIRAASQD